MDFDDVDLFAQTVVGDVRDPYPGYAEMRHSSPVAETDHFGFTTTSIYRYHDVVAVLKQPELFSSDIYNRTIGLVMGPTILGMDGTEHVLNRGLVASAFRRKALESWTTSLIEPTVHELIDRFAPRGESELVREFTIQFPIRIIARMLGIPSDDFGRFARLSIELISIARDIPRGLAASQSLHEYFAGILEERREQPADDLISSLVQADIDGERLDDELIFGFLRLLLPAGAETTYRLLGNLVFALLSDDDQMTMVRSDRSLIPSAIEEALRWESPVQIVSRIPTKDAVVGGVPIPEGKSMTLRLGSANRDETVFEDPDRFDLRRQGAPHVAFAEGPHRCLGEHLARLEVTTALNAMLDRLPDLRLVPGDVDPHINGSAFRSPTSLPVEFATA
ncbi:MAG: cytochrome P450 [Actinomycetota bacterium]|nr:cytochrome P450 [Actinomycetota bacterium]